MLVLTSEVRHRLHIHPIDTSLGVHTPSRLFRSSLPVPMFVRAIQARVSDENAAGSKSTYPSEPVPNSVRVSANQTEPPSPLHVGIGEQVWR